MAQQQNLTYWSQLTKQERALAMRQRQIVQLTNGTAPVDSLGRQKKHDRRKLRVTDGDTIEAKFNGEWKPVWPVRNKLDNGLSYVTFRMER
jgi:hypothetical protein